jgi:hypothetical protein
MVEGWKKVLRLQERAERIRGATKEINSMFEDFQMQAMGGMVGAWELWETKTVQ